MQEPLLKRVVMELSGEGAVLLGDDGRRYPVSAVDGGVLAGQSKGARVAFEPREDGTVGEVQLLNPDTRGLSTIDLARLPSPSEQRSWAGHYLFSLWPGFFCLKGRASRTEYWSIILVGLAVELALVIAGVALLLTDPAPGIVVRSGQRTVAETLLVIAVLHYCLSIIPGVAALVRRLHDTGRNGFWVLIAFLPFGPLVLLVMSFLPGDGGINRFGFPERSTTAPERG